MIRMLLATLLTGFRVMFVRLWLITLTVAPKFATRTRVHVTSSRSARAKPGENRRCMAPPDTPLHDIHRRLLLRSVLICTVFITTVDQAYCRRNRSYTPIRLQLMRHLPVRSKFRVKPVVRTRSLNLILFNSNHVKPDFMVR